MVEKISKISRNLLNDIYVERLALEEYFLQLKILLAQVGRALLLKKIN